MNILHGYAEKIRRGEEIPLPLAMALSAAVPAVQLGMWLRLRRPRHRVAARVISFGNITAGGTGKTPAVIERARIETAAGHCVAVLTRGYGSQKTPEPLIVPAGEANPDLADRIGEEAALIRCRVPEVTIVKSSDRVAGAAAAIVHGGCDTLLLDDGFQQVALERDENILVIDATNPFGNGRLLPRGILREPLRAMRRATAILLTRCDQAEALPALEAQLRTLCPGIPLRKTRHAPTRLWRVANGEQQPLDTLQNTEIAALCAIGNPDAFFATLERRGATIRQRIPFPDHQTIPVEAIPKEGLVIITEKDAMRLKSPPENLLALGIDLQDMT
jgi:tetraacyldisaccharide 4'-kinase